LPLTVKPRGGIYYLRGTVRGISVYESTKTRDAQEAEDIRAKREADLSLESIFGKRAVVTFDQAADSYIQSGGSSRFVIEQKADGTVTGLAVEFKGQILDKIGQSDLDKVANKLYPGTTPETRNRCVYTPFIAIWNHAAADARKWAEPRKWQRPRKPKGTAAKVKVSRAGTRPVAYDYAWRFVSAMSPAPACLMTALFYTGMRPIELFLLEAEEVNIEGRWIALSSSKTDEPRGIPIHEMLVPMMTPLVERGGYLFRTHKNQPYPPTKDGGGQIKSAIKGARARSKIRDVSPYTARHSVSTQLVVNGVHPFIKDQILGHAATEMSRVYTHIPQKPLIEAINTLPTIEAWASAPWLIEPLKWQRRLARKAKP